MLEVNLYNYCFHFLIQFFIQLILCSFLLASKIKLIQNLQLIKSFSITSQEKCILDNNFIESQNT